MSRRIESALAPNAVKDLYLEGVQAVERVARQLGSADWEQPACGHWSGTETARHLLAVARWYHAWLDRALAGDKAQPFPARDMDEQNRQALVDLSDLEAVNAIAGFAESAEAYVDRALNHWDLPFGYPYGLVTVGLHCAVAATEWHLHAWDLSTVAGPLHSPQNPQRLFTAAGLCVAHAEGGIRGAVLRKLVPIGARRSPWETLLTRSGRKPRAQ